MLDATDTQRQGLPPMSLVEEGDRVGVRVADPTGDRTYTVTFSRTGATRGEIRVLDGRGAVLYGGTLGMGGTMFPVVQDGGVGLDAGASDGGRDGVMGGRSPRRGRGWGRLRARGCGATRPSHHGGRRGGR